MNEPTRFEQADELIKSTSCLKGRMRKLFFFALSIRNIGDTTAITSFPDILHCLVSDHAYGGKDARLYAQALADLRRATDIHVPMNIERLPNYNEIKNTPKLKKIRMVEGNLIRFVSYDADDPYNEPVIFYYDEMFLPLLDDLKMKFTWICMEQARRLDGKYSLRLYEWARMMLKDGEQIQWEWSLNEDNRNMPCLKNFFGISDATSYQEWREIKRRVLDPSIKEINEKVDDLIITYTTIKTKRTIIALAMVVKAVHKTVIRNTNTRKQTKAELPEWYYKNDPGKADQATIDEIQNLLHQPIKKGD